MSLRVFLRKLTEADRSELLLLHQSSRSLHFPWVSPPLDEQGCQDYLDRCKNDDFEGLLICHRADDRIVGVVNLSQIFYRSFQNAYLGYYANIALRINVRTMFEGSIDTIAKAIKIIPALAHPVLEHKPPTLDFV